MSEKPNITLFYPSYHYSSKTLAFRPIAVTAIRALCIMGIEWTTLDYVEHAPPLVKLSTFVIAALTLGVLDQKDWLHFKGRYYYPVSLITLILAWLAVAGASYNKFSGPLNGVPLAAEGSVTKPQIPAITALKSFTEKQKDELKAILNELATSYKSAASLSLRVSGVRENYEELMPGDSGCDDFCDLMNEFSANLAALDNNLFHRLSDENPNFVDQISFITGDYASSGIDATRKLIDKVRDIAKNLKNQRGDMNVAIFHAINDLLPSLGGSIQSQNSIVQNWIAISQERLKKMRESL